MKHTSQWLTASPLWRLALEDPGAKPSRFAAPALLRFEGDTFMDDIQQTLAKEPERLAEYVLRQETWETARYERAGWISKIALDQEGPPKLYHPAHNRFYLVAANLVCQRVGLPDRRIDTAAEERAGFVVRRLVPAAGQTTVNPSNSITYDEYGWIGDRQQGRWVKAVPEDEVRAGEELLPLSPLNFREDSRARRVLAGLIPVASREIYEGGGVSSEPSAEPATNSRLAAFEASVVAGLQQIRNLGDLAELSISERDELAREALLFSMVDFAAFLERELPDVWDEIQEAPANGSDLYDYLLSEAIDTVRWSEMLAQARSIRDEFVTTEPYTIRFTDENGLSVLLSFADIGTSLNSVLPESTSGLPPLTGEVEDALGDPEQASWESLVEDRVTPLETLPASLTDAGARDRLIEALLAIGDFLEAKLPTVWDRVTAGSPGSLTGAERSLYNLLEQQRIADVKWTDLLGNTKAFESDIRSGNLSNRIAVVSLGANRQQVSSFGVQVRTSGLTNRMNAVLEGTAPEPDLPETPETYYVVRCIYRRPNCKNFTIIKASAPTRPFRLAEFFDPEAPAREVRIRMPVDTSHAGLSRFPKNVSVLISNELRRQMSRAQEAGMQGMMDGDLPEAGPSGLGVICTFSIPIISICALILLMIIVQLLNIVFWWLPLFRICLPLNLKK